MQEQHSDEDPGAGRVAQGAAGGVPEPLMGQGERPRRSSGHQRGRAGQRAGLADQHVEIVIQDQVLGVLVQAA